MELKIRVADPAGNITIFVMSQVDRREYASVARQLLMMEEFGAEQVAFVEEGDRGPRMEMMGGEFCGNASRSFGYLLSRQSEDRRQTVSVSVSGSDRPLLVEVDQEKGTSRIEMPLPTGRQEIDLGEEGRYPLVVFDGICHLIIESEPKDEKFVALAIEKAKEACPCGAYGVMFLKGSHMVPVVYVEETDSTVWESSCGSGSTGAAVYLSGKEGDGEHSYELIQPGGKIEVTVVREKGQVIRCLMGGPVTISGEMTVEISR